jgi:hypothetical protein
LFTKVCRQSKFSAVSYSLIIVIDSRKKKLAQRDGTNVGQSGSLFEEKARPTGKSLKTGSSARRQDKLSLARLKELEQEKEREVLSGYKRVRELWNRISRSKDGMDESVKMVEAEREWLFEADKLVETFRETRNLFSTARVRTIFHPSPVCMTSSISRIIRFGACFLGRNGRGEKKITRRLMKAEWLPDCNLILVRPLVSKLCWVI